MDLNELPGPNPVVGRARLVAQGLLTRPFATPADAVSAFLAMQGQDLPGAIASAALRTPELSAEAVLADMDAGRLVRGYPMRGTVFLMAADDLLWVSELCNAAALRAARRRRAQLELTDEMVGAARERALELLAQTPTGMPRSELMAEWQAIGTPVDRGRGYHVLAHLVGEGDLCFGPWNGADQNVMATSAWLPSGTRLAERFNGDRQAAVVELLRRYLTSHGPATLRDVAWWTKLSLREVRAAWAEISDEFESGPFGNGGSGADEQIWRPGLHAEVAALDAEVLQGPLLLPGFDEFILGYADRLFAMTPEQHALLVPGNNGVFRRALVADGTVRGFWKRAGTPGRRSLQVEPFEPLNDGWSEVLQTSFSAFPFPAA